MGANLEHTIRGGSRNQEHICHLRLSRPTCHKHTDLQLLIRACATEIYYLEWQQEASVQIHPFLWRENSWVTYPSSHQSSLPFHSHTLPIRYLSTSGFSFLTKNCVQNIEQCLLAHLTGKVKGSSSEKSRRTHNEQEILSACIGCQVIGC